MKMYTFFLLLFFCLGSTQVYGTPINTYFMNKKFDLRTSRDWKNPVMECVRTDYNQTFPYAREMTICMRTFSLGYQKPGWRYAYAWSLGILNKDKTNYEEAMGYGSWKSGPWAFYSSNDTETYSWIGLGTDVMDMQTWHHNCLSLSMISGISRLVENGKLTIEAEDPKLNTLFDKLSPRFDVATPSCIWRPDGSGYMSLYGRVTDFQVFGRELSVEEMKDFTGCRKRLRGDIIDWDKVRWIFEEGNKSEMEVLDFETEVCLPQESSIHLIPLNKVFSPFHQHMCKKMSGRPATYDDKEQWDRIVTFTSNSNFKDSVCSTQEDGKYKLKLMLGTTDEEEEGIWRHFHNNKQVEYLNWAPNRPYLGGTKYNCLEYEIIGTPTNLSTSDVSVAHVGDSECAVQPICGLCHVDLPVRKITVRGLCEASMFDRMYFYNIAENGQVMYFGELSSIVIHDPIEDRWSWYDRKDNTSFATSVSPKDSLLLGVNNFEFKNVNYDACYKEGVPTLKKIKFTTCVDNQFTCNDGECIDIEQRCDQTSNCLDESDEDGCRMIFQKDNYKKTVAPFSFNATSKKNIPVNVNISMAIKDMLKIEEIDHIYTLKYTMIMEWYDFRLKYYNLKKTRSANSLATTEIERIWIPFIVFENTEKNEATIASKNTEVTITREGDFEISSSDFMEEINIFKGGDNRITFQEVYTKTFKCEYQLQLYPFDTQTCTAIMVVRELEWSSMMITPDQIVMEGETVLTQYIIPFWSLSYVNQTDPNQGIEMTIILKRRIINAIMTIYLPTILILIIVYVTNFFKTFFFEAVVTVNLTALLVLTTLFISVSGALPPTAYVKMIDIWLIFAQIVPFFEVLLHTFMDSMRTEGEREINHHGKTIKVGADGKPIHDEEEGSVSESLSSTTTIVKPWKEDYSGSAKSNRTVPWTEDVLSPRDIYINNDNVVNAGLIARDERQEVENRREFYSNLETNDFWITIGELTAKVFIPCGILLFAAVYWTYGLTQYMAF